METKEEYLKALRMGFCYQREFEKAFKEYPLEKIIKDLQKKLYGIDTDGEEATKKKI